MAATVVACSCLARDVCSCLSLVYCLGMVRSQKHCERRGGGTEIGDGFTIVVATQAARAPSNGQQPTAQLWPRPAQETSGSNSIAEHRPAQETGYSCCMRARCLLPDSVMPTSYCMLLSPLISM
jgi:hypothetical protein